MVQDYCQSFGQKVPFFKRNAAPSDWKCVSWRSISARKTRKRENAKTGSRTRKREKRENAKTARYMAKVIGDGVYKGQGSMKVEAGFARRITTIAKNLQVGRISTRPSWIAPWTFWVCLCRKFQHENRRHRWQPLLSLVTYIPCKDIRSADVKCENVWKCKASWRKTWRCQINWCTMRRCKVS